MDNLQSNPYGVLRNAPDIQLQRNYFKEMCSLLGVNVIFRAPRPDKHFTTYSEIESNYFTPQVVGCIFTENPDQKTMKKLGWVAELDGSPSIISVPFDVEGLQVGALFIVPSALNPKSGRVFRVTELSTIMIYPASITCKLVPEYENTFSNDTYNHQTNSFNILNKEEY